MLISEVACRSVSDVRVLKGTKEECSLFDALHSLESGFSLVKELRYIVWGRCDGDALKYPLCLDKASSIHIVDILSELVENTEKPYPLLQDVYEIFSRFNRWFLEDMVECLVVSA